MNPDGPSQQTGSIGDRAASLLAASRSPISSRELAMALLGLERAPERAGRLVLEALLAGDPRFECARDGLWSLTGLSAGSQNANAQPAPRVRAHPEPGDDRTLLAEPWTVWELDHNLRAIAVVRLERGKRVAERIELASRAGRGPERTLSSAALRRLARLSVDAHAATFSRARTFDRLAEAIDACNGSASPILRIGRPFSIPRIALGLLGPPRPASPEDLAPRLGLESLCADDPLVRARLGAACLAALLERADVAGIASAAALAGQRPPGSVEFSFEGRTFDPVFLHTLPEDTGVYRFFDKDDALLYVGKAKNLRRRVRSYFVDRLRPDSRVAAWIDGVYRIETERVGSEPEALIREAAAIAARTPSANRQRAVHERPVSYGKSLVLLLPAKKPGAVDVHLIASGAAVGRVRLGPRGGGRPLLQLLLEQIYFEQRSDADHADHADHAPRSGNHARGSAASRRAPESFELGEEVREPGLSRVAAASRRAPERSGLGEKPREPGGKRRRQGTLPARRRTAALLGSWIARKGRALPAFDPTDLAGPVEALAVALRYAEAIRRGETDIVYRR